MGLPDCGSPKSEASTHLSTWTICLTEADAVSESQHGASSSLASLDSKSGVAFQSVSAPLRSWASVGDQMNENHIENDGTRLETLGSDWMIIGYKVVAKVDQEYLSIWAGDRTKYDIGATVLDRATRQRASGLYVCASPWSALNQYLPAGADNLRKAPRALLQCACLGPFVEYDGDKAACSSLTVLKALPMPRDYEKQADEHTWRRLSSRDRGGHQSAVGLAFGQMNTLFGWEVLAYKVVAKLGERYFSIWAGREVQYRLGATMREHATPGRQRGLYVFRTPEAAAAFAFPNEPSDFAVCPRAVIRCSCKGPFVAYPGGKVACSKLTPLEEVMLLAPQCDSPQGRQVCMATQWPVMPLETSGKPSGTSSDRFGRHFAVSGVRPISVTFGGISKVPVSLPARPSSARARFSSIPTDRPASIARFQMELEYSPCKPTRTYSYGWCEKEQRVVY